MSRRQDYVARIRYRNDLPPPPCPPKMLDIPVDVRQVSGQALVSQSAQTRGVNVDVDMELGMPLDLTLYPEIFCHQDFSGVCRSDSQLDPEDRVLLRPPNVKNVSKHAGAAAVSIVSHRNMPKVSFLRRTEYIASESSSSKPSSDPLLSLASKKDRVEPKDDFKTQVKAVESTFDCVLEDLETLRHPKRKHLRAKECYPLVPEFQNLDLTHVAIRMIGSAAFAGSTKSPVSDQLEVSILKPMNAGESMEWMSFYTASEPTSQSLKKELEESSESKYSYDDQTSVYRFGKYSDYDMDLVKHESPLEEVAIYFDERDKVARYVPITGRTNLKRRRVYKQQQQVVLENSIAAINLSLRELSNEEVVSRDRTRSEFDPVTYAVEEEEEEEEPADDLDDLPKPDPAISN